MKEKWFCYDEEDLFFEVFDTQEKALECAREQIESRDGNFSEELFDGLIRVGVITHESSVTNKRDLSPQEKEQYPEFDFMCNIEMLEVVGENNKHF